MATPELTWQQVSARRLIRNHLSTPADSCPADVVRALCGAHAQVLSAAELSIGLRICGATRDDTRKALWSERSLVKTFGPRGTVHLLPTEDLPMWTGALSAVPRTGQAPEAMRMTPDQTDEVIGAIAAALSDAELTVEELSAEVIAATGPWAGDLVMPAFQTFWPRWRQVISRAANAGVLCYGANKGRNATYTNPHRWLPRFEPLDATEALAELLRRYLHSYGPAAPQHFAQWLNAPKDFVAKLFRSLRDELQEVELDGSAAWLLAGDTAMPTEPPTGVRLLPYFDSYVVGAHPRGLLYPGKAAERALAGGQAGNFPVVLVDGQVAGVWHQRRSGRRLHVTVEPLRRLTAKQRRELDEQVEQVGLIVGAVPELTIGEVSVGGHA
ncbi:MAG TPA: winged helix DNA-binding domain-containing protein [Kribbella sp.]|nr:winged helix DNA-binding domain-containing protein [Kribbella sp.]